MQDIQEPYDLQLPKNNLHAVCHDNSDNNMREQFYMIKKTIIQIISAEKLLKIKLIKLLL